MAVNIVSALSAWTNENASKVLYTSILRDAITPKFLAKEFGVMGNMTLNAYDVNGGFSDGAACGVSENTAAISQRVLAAAPLKFDVEICMASLLSKYTAWQCAPDVQRVYPNFEEYLAAEFAAKLSKNFEKYIWKGATTLRADLIGLAAEIEGAVSGAATSTETTVYGKLDDLYKSMSEKENAIIFINEAKFVELKAEMIARNLFHFGVDREAMNEIDMPLGYKVVATSGLNGVAKAYAVVADWAVIGTNVDRPEAEFKTIYDEKAETETFRSRFVAGAQIARAEGCAYIAL